MATEWFMRLVDEWMQILQGECGSMSHVVWKVCETCMSHEAWELRETCASHVVLICKTRLSHVWKICETCVTCGVENMRGTDVKSEMDLKRLWRVRAGY